MDEARSVPVCEYLHVHEEAVEQVLSQLPAEERLYDLAEVFRVFGDTTRIRILYVLFEHELCVCDIAKLLGMTQSAVSHQLRILKDAKLVRFRREGKTVFYTLDDQHVRSVLELGMEHVLERKQNHKGDIIMQKKYSIVVDCANCAAAVERKLNELEGVESVSISYLAQKMIVHYADVVNEKALLKEMLKVARKIEPDFEIEA